MAEPGPLDEARKDRLAEVLKRSSTQLDALVTQFLELARAEAGLPNEDRERVDLAEQLRGLTSAIRADPRYEKVEIRFTPPAGPIVMNGVAQRLERALRNLLENAASFAGDGGWVEVKTELAPEGVRIRITDSGPGIASENLPRLFDRFFSRRGDKHGTGLGLALVRAVVEAHGGSVGAESLPGAGATFIVSLPFGAFTNVSHAGR
jgi:two-component system sensor histidine kinase ChvG